MLVFRCMLALGFHAPSKFELQRVVFTQRVQPKVTHLTANAKDSIISPGSEYDQICPYV